MPVVGLLVGPVAEVRPVLRRIALGLVLLTLVAASVGCSAAELTTTTGYSETSQATTDTTGPSSDTVATGGKLEDSFGTGHMARLDCPLVLVASMFVRGEGRTVREIMRVAEPTVARVAADQVSAGIWWGFDPDESMIAGLMATEAPGEFRVWTCLRD